MNPKKLIRPRTLVKLASGLVLFLLAFILSGPGAVLSSAGRGVWAFWTLIGLSAAALALRAAAWKTTLGWEGRKNASLAAVLVSLLPIGGVPIRLAVLKKETGIADAAGSVAADEAVRALAGMIFAAGGLFLGFLLTPGDIRMRGLMLIVAVGGFGYAVIQKRRRKGFFSAFVGGLPKGLVSPAVRGKMEERDRFLFRLRSENRGAFYAVLSVHLAVSTLFALEILAVGRAIDVYFPAPLSLALAALIAVLRPVASSFPAAFGVLEGGVALVLALTFGAPFAPVGVGVVWILRLKTLFWWIVGLAAAGNPLAVFLKK